MCRRFVCDPCTSSLICSAYSNLYSYPTHTCLEFDLNFIVKQFINGRRNSRALRAEMLGLNLLLFERLVSFLTFQPWWLVHLKRWNRGCFFLAGCCCSYLKTTVDVLFIVPWFDLCKSHVFYLPQKKKLILSLIIFITKFRSFTELKTTR